MPKIIKIDFDGTIVEDAYPNIGKPIKGAFETIKALQKAKYKLILWTCREGENLNAAIDFLKLNGIVFDVVNEPHPENPFSKLGKNRKPYAHYHIDDKNFGGLPEWSVINSYFFKQKRYHETPNNISENKKQFEIMNGNLYDSFLYSILSFVWTLIWALPVLLILFICSAIKLTMLKIAAHPNKRQNNFIIYTIDNTENWFNDIPRAISIGISALTWTNVGLIILLYS